MDGDAIYGSFAECSGPECLKEVLPKYGQRVKVHKVLRKSITLGGESEVGCSYFSTI